MLNIHWPDPSLSPNSASYTTQLLRLPCWPFTGNDRVWCTDFTNFFFPYYFNFSTTLYHYVTFWIRYLRYIYFCFHFIQRYWQTDTIRFWEHLRGLFNGNYFRFLPTNIFAIEAYIFVSFQRSWQVIELIHYCTLVPGLCKTPVSFEKLIDIVPRDL